MNPGKLRHRVTIQQFAEVLDGYGTPTGSSDWQDVATVWASVEPLSGREYLLAENVNTEAKIRVKMRYRKGVTTGMRIKYGERMLDIQSVADIEERHREMELMCIEVKK